MRSQVQRELMTTLAAAAALATVALVVVAVTPSKQATVLEDTDFMPWKAPPWDDRAGQGQMAGKWYDQGGDFVGNGQQKAPTQILFDPYSKPWLHEPLSSHSIAKERNDYTFDKYAKYYGYGSQYAAPTQQLYEDPYREDSSNSEEKAETQLYYKQRLNDFENELTDRPLAVAGRQQMLAAPTQQLYNDPYREDSSNSEEKAETQLYYKQRLNDFENELTDRPLAVAGRQQMLAQPWQLDGSDRKLALQEEHKYDQQKWQRYFSGETGDKLV